MKATQIRIQECNFHPTHVEITAGNKIEVRIMPHKATSTYDSTSRSFILSCSEFESDKLYPGDVYKHKFQRPGEYILTCPLYAWMKASIKVKPPKEASFNNPQDPDLLPFRITEETKKNTKIAVTPYKRMYSDKGFLKYMSIPSSVTSEPDEEIKVEEEPEVDELEKDIEKLFLSVKDECERDRVQPNVYEEYSTEKEIIPLRRHINTSMVNQPTTTVNTDTQEIKPGVVFKITAMGPSRYFKKEEPAIKATNKRFLKRKHRQIKLKLKKEQVLVKDMIDTIISIKAANQEIDEWSYNIPKTAKGKILAEKRKFELHNKLQESQEKFDKLSSNFTPLMLEKAENFIKSSEKVTDLHNQDWAKRNMTIKLFGVEKFWWVEKIPIENPVDLKLSPDFDYKLVMKILKERNFNIGFKSSCK